MMALPHVPHEPFETGRVALDPDGQMDWVLPLQTLPVHPKVREEIQRQRRLEKT
jgi:hypothetical protein